MTPPSSGCKATDFMDSEIAIWGLTSLKGFS